MQEPRRPGAGKQHSSSSEDRLRFLSPGLSGFPILKIRAEADSRDKHFSGLGLRDRPGKRTKPITCFAHSCCSNAAAQKIESRWLCREPLSAPPKDRRMDGETTTSDRVRKQPPGLMVGVELSRTIR
jgi:hypothetical protein